MKNIKFIKSLFMSLVLLMTISCDKDSMVTNPDDRFAQLNNSTTVTIIENSGTTVNIGVILGGPQSTATQIELDVTGDASRYQISSTSFSIPAGETSATVTLTAVDDNLVNGDVAVVVALSSSSSVPVGLAGQGVGAISKTINIIDDNVPCNDYTITIVNDRWGTETMYDLLDSSNNVVTIGGPFSDAVGTQVQNITLPDGCYTLRIFDWYGDSMSSDPSSYTVSCGAASFTFSGASFDGIPGFNASSAPINPLYGSRFRSTASASGAYVGHAEQFQFCVNQ